MVFKKNDLFGIAMGNGNHMHRCVVVSVIINLSRDKDQEDCFGDCTASEVVR